MLKLDTSHPLYAPVDFARNRLREFQEQSPQIYDYACSAFRVGVQSAAALGVSYSLSYLARTHPLIGLPLTIYSLGLRFLYIPKILKSEYDNIRREKELKRLSQAEKSGTDRNTMVLICKAKEEGFWGLPLSASFVETIRSFSKTDAISYRKTGAVEEVNEMIDLGAEQGKKMPLLILMGHGYCNEIDLGKESVSLYNLDKLHLSKLDPNADIILFSCETGTPMEYRMSIAELFQYHAGSARKVHAPTKSITNASAIRRKDNNMKVNFLGAPYQILGIGFGDETVPTAEISYKGVVKKIDKILAHFKEGLQQELSTNSNSDLLHAKSLEYMLEIKELKNCLESSSGQQHSP